MRAQGKRENRYHLLFSRNLASKLTLLLMGELLEFLLFQGCYSQNCKSYI